MSHPETAHKKAIFDACRREFPYVKLIPVFTGKVRLRHGAWLQGAEPGTPDFVGFLPGGRFLGVEVKTPTGRTKKDRAANQAAFRDHANAAGCLVVQVSSFEQLSKILVAGGIPEKEEK